MDSVHRGKDSSLEGAEVYNSKQYFSYRNLPEKSIETENSGGQGLCLCGGQEEGESC